MLSKGQLPPPPPPPSLTNIDSTVFQCTWPTLTAFQYTWTTLTILQYSWSTLTVFQYTYFLGAPAIVRAATFEVAGYYFRGGHYIRDIQSKWSSYIITILYKVKLFSLIAFLYILHVRQSTSLKARVWTCYLDIEMSDNFITAILSCVFHDGM